MTRSSQAALTAASPARSRSLAEIASAAFATVWTWRFRVRSRRQLSNLDPRMMRDIGIDPLDLQHEIEKPFWRA